WMYNTRRIYLGIGMTPYQKLCETKRLSKQVCLFPVVNLDNMIPLLEIYFKNFSFQIVSIS
ncbi:MAG: hypothetical protein ACK4F0_08530, partial [Candidatus Ratteibacteria bacterium]